MISTTNKRRRADTVIRKAVVVPPSPGVRVDRYGWEIGRGSSPISEEELRFRAEESMLEARRSKLWEEYLYNWSYYSWKGRSKVQNMIREGIPDAYRAKVWKVLLEPQYMNLLGFRQINIDEFIALGSSDVWGVIEADLVRTMPHCPMFNDERVINSLRRILYAYSNMDPELDYTQGMSFFGGFLLLYMDEQTAFQCFKQIMSNKFQWRNYFLPGFPRLLEINKVWEVILQDKYPKVAANIDRINLNSLIYTPSWFLTAYLNVDFPIAVRLQIFDNFCEFGTRALLSFALTIISRHKNDLAIETIEKIMIILQRPYSTEQAKDWRYLLKKYKKHWLSQKEYEEYFKKAGVKLFP